MADATILGLLEQSQWVIEGTVEEVGASTMPEVPASTQTAIVRVDEILHGAPAFDDHKGRRITLYSPNAAVKTKTSAVFFTRSWLFGSGVAVIEVGQIPKGDGKTVVDDIRAAEQEQADRRLTDRLAKASLIVAGVVTDLGHGPELRRQIETEHDPQWLTAYVQVREALKGKPAGSVVPVVFASSLDELWIDSPKPKQGESGVFILQADQQEKGWPVLRVPGLSALDALDLQPVSELERIRRLLEGVK